MMKKFSLFLLFSFLIGVLAFVGGYYYSSGHLLGYVLADKPEKETALGVSREEGREEGYRIGIMEEVSSAKGWVSTDEQEPEIIEKKIEDGVIINRPLGEVILSIIVDASKDMGAKEMEPYLTEIEDGLKNFLPDLMEKLILGIRTMGGGEYGTCEESRVLMAMGEERSFGRSLNWKEITPNGQRNISRAMYLAAGDMATFRGRKGLAVITAGSEECGEWPCETAEALYHTGDRIRTFVLELNNEVSEKSRIQKGEGGQTGPGSFTDDLSGEGIACLAEAGGGFKVPFANRGELGAALERIADNLSRNVNIRFFRSPDNELLGVEDPELAPWEVRVVPLTGTMRKLLSSRRLPAQFKLPPGQYEVVGRYRDIRLTVPELNIAEGKEIEIRLFFRSGQLFVQEGEEKWAFGTGCSPEVSVYPSGNRDHILATRCGLPAHFVLKPGRYDVFVHGQGQSAWLEDVAVSEGRAVARSITPQPDEGMETFIIDNKGVEN